MNIPVVFRRIDGEVKAFFPTLPHDYDHIIGYAFIGKTPDDCVFQPFIGYFKKGHPVNETVYMPLLRKLESACKTSDNTFIVYKDLVGYSRKYADTTETKGNNMNKEYMGINMELFYQQKMLLLELSDAADNHGYKKLADALEGIVNSVFDPIQNEAEENSCFTLPKADEDSGRFSDDKYNDVLAKILAEEKPRGSFFEMNPEDDILHFLEDSGCYDAEIERMTADGTYDDFVHKVKERIDWDNLCDSMGQTENEAISVAVDTLIH